MQMLKIGVSIAVAIVIVTIIFGATQIEQNQTDETISEITTTPEIDIMLEKIKNDKIENDESAEPYVAKDRKWVTSGPFKIDRSEYILGEKIFVNIDGITNFDRGEVMTYRPINSTHFKIHHVMPFDGSAQRNNYYFTPDLNELRGICSAEQLVGEWKMVFDGTEHSDIKFKVVEKIMPGYEERYQTIVNKGRC